MSTPASSMTKPVRHWSVSAIATANEPLKMWCAGKPLTQSAPATLDGVSPVELLLISVATCFALSCRAVPSLKALPLQEFEVNVVGVKAAGLPSRLDSIELTVVFGGGMSTTTAEAIAADAKKMCTVTNTLQTAPVSISIESRGQ